MESPAEISMFYIKDEIFAEHQKLFTLVEMQSEFVEYRLPVTISPLDFANAPPAASDRPIYHSVENPNAASTPRQYHNLFLLRSHHLPSLGMSDEF